MKHKSNLDFVSGFSGVLTKGGFPLDWVKLTKGGNLDGHWKDRYFTVEISLQSSSCKWEEKYIYKEFAQAFSLKWSHLILFKIFWSKEQENILLIKSIYNCVWTFDTGNWGN